MGKGNKLQDIRTKFRLFLFIPLVFILALDMLYILLGVGALLSFTDTILHNTVFIATYIGIIIVLNIAFFALIVIISNKYIKDDLLSAISDFYVDMRNFYENNKFGFQSWAQRIIKSPKEMIEISKYFHNNIANQVYQLSSKITTDYLTGLRTSIILRQDLEQYPNHVIAVLNISNFKEINSFYGVKLADDILYSVAQVLKSYFKNENYLLYRIHGDDFAILWTNCTDRGVFIQKLEGFLDYLGKKELLIDSYTYLNISATIGVAFSFENAKYSMVNAIMALHHAKEYKNPIVVYSRNLPILNVFKSNIQYAEIIHRALKNKDVIPYFQKIYGIQPHTSNEEFIKFEALMRIKDEDGHIILPGMFLEVAKRSSSYSKLSRLMIESAFAQLAEHKDCIFSVNLALEDMNSMDFLMWFVDRISYYKIEGRVVVEITEQESVEGFDSVNNFIAKIKDIGIKIALDDFGSGYSNFSILMKLQIDYLKIDGSLIKNIDKDKNAQIIVKTIVQFAKDLGLKTIAEFVCSREIFEVIKEIGIDYAQGYFIGKPDANIDIKPPNI